MVDVSKLSSAELMDAFKKKKAEEAVELAKKAAEAREELDKYAQKKYGFTLAQIFTARRTDKPAKASEDDIPPGTYHNQETGKGFTYKGKGKGRVPGWLRSLSPEQRRARRMAD